MAASFVQSASSNSGSSSGGTVVVALTNPTTAGNTLIAPICMPAAYSVVSVIDTLGNPWIRAANAASSDGNTEIWYSRGIAAGAASVTVTYTSG